MKMSNIFKDQILSEVKEDNIVITGMSKGYQVSIDQTIFEDDQTYHDFSVCFLEMDGEKLANSISVEFDGFICNCPCVVRCEGEFIVRVKSINHLKTMLTIVNNFVKVGIEVAETIKLAVKYRLDNDVALLIDSYTEKFEANNLEALLHSIKCVHDKTELELTWYLDIGLWLQNNEVQFCDFNWSEYICSGSPLNINEAEFILTGGKGMFHKSFGINDYHNDWFNQNSIDEKYKKYDTVVDIRKPNWLGTCTWEQEIQSFTNYCSFTDSAIDFLKEGKERMAKKAYALATQNFAMAIHCNGYGKFYQDVCNPYQVDSDICYNSQLVMKGKDIVTKGLVIPKGLTIETVTHLLRLTSIFGKEVVCLLDDEYLKNHLSCIGCDMTVAIPAKFQKAVATSRKLVEWVIDNNIMTTEDDWDTSKSARVCIINKLANIHGVDVKRAEEVFNNPSALEALRFIKLNGEGVIKHNLPEVEFTIDGLTMSVLPKNDIRNLYIGEITQCCQKLGGYAHDVCEEGWNDSNSVNYVFTKGSAILAHMWVWKAIDGSIVIDSIEGLKQADSKTIASLIKMLDKSHKGKTYVSETHYGLTGDVIEALELTDLVQCPEPCYDYSYTDVYDEDYTDGEVYLV